MDDTLGYSPVRPVTPPRAVTVDLRAYGARRMRWGVATPVWARANGWRPEQAVDAVVENCIMSAYGDWWVQCRTSLLSSRGQVLLETGLLVPPHWIREQ